ncbi:MAG TPA: hypothetical protein VF476_00485 [Chitinophagaceae bacterium]
MIQQYLNERKYNSHWKTLFGQVLEDYENWKEDRVLFVTFVKDGKVKKPWWAWMWRKLKRTSTIANPSVMRETKKL